LLLIGDSGGGSFKLLLQDLSQFKPNSPFSGYLVGEMDAKESYQNLKKAFGNYQVRRRKEGRNSWNNFNGFNGFSFLLLLAKEQIDEIQDQVVTHRDKKGNDVSKVIRLFLGGDYDFLCENYDHPGASSTHFCLWCPISRHQRKDDPVKMTAGNEELWGKGGRVHTLESLKTLGHTHRVSNKHDDLQPREPIFSFQLDRVVVLPLHITLGLTRDALEILRDTVRAQDRQGGVEDHNDEFAACKNELEQLIAKAEELKHDQEAVLQEAAAIARATSMATLWKVKISQEGTADGTLKCGETMKSGKICEAGGKASHGYFCGRHKESAESEEFQAVRAIVGTSLAAALASNPQQRVTIQNSLDIFLKESDNARVREEMKAMKVKEERKRVDSDRDMQKKTLAGLRGASELELFRILEEDIKVKFTHRGGDFAMGGMTAAKSSKTMRSWSPFWNLTTTRKGLAACSRD